MKSVHASSARALAIALVAGTAFVAHPGYAETTPMSATSGSASDTSPTAPETPATTSPSDRQLGDIIVTAQRKSENLQRTPIAVTALSADDLRAKSTQSFSDLAKSVPGLSISSASTTAPGGALPVVYIRGIGQQDPSIFQDPGVGIYVDGVYVARAAGAAIDLPDIGRVEVLRGPQGTLFGKNAVGGAINIVTRDPTKNWTGQLDGTGGSYDLVNLRGYVSGPLSDTIGVSLAADFRNEDGYVDRLAYPSREKIGEQGRERHRSVRGRATWEPIAGLKVDLSADYSHYHDTSAPGIGTLTAPTAVYTLWNNLVGIPSGLPWTQANTNTGDKYKTFATGPNFANDDIYGFSGTLSYGLGDATIKSITAYRHMKEAYSRDSDGSPVNFFNATGFHKLKQFSEELQLYGHALDSKLDYMGGLYYLRETGNEQDFADVAPGLYTATHNPALEIGRLYGVGVLTNSYAAFGQTTFHFNDKLSATVGIRYTSESKSDDVSSFGVESGILYVPPTHVSDRFKAWTPKFGIQYQATSNILFYASATKGFKSGGFNGRINTLAGLTEFNPETVWSYEAGIKATLADRRVRINLAGYHMDYSNLQLAYFILTSTGTVTAVSNVAAAKLNGGEAEITLIPTTGLEIGGSLSYNSNNYTDIQPGAQVVKGDKIPYVPKWQGSASIQYTAELGGGRQLIPRLDFSYQSKSFAVISNSPVSELNPRGLLNARLTYRPSSKRWSIAGYVTNLTNKFYYTSAQDNTTASLLYRLVGRPREFGGTVGFKF